MVDWGMGIDGAVRSELKLHNCDKNTIRATSREEEEKNTREQSFINHNNAYDRLVAVPFGEYSFHFQVNNK